MPPKDADKLKRMMLQLPGELEPVFAAAAKSSDMVLREIAARGVVYHPIESKKTLFIGLHQKAEVAPETVFSERPETQMQEEKRLLIESITQGIGLEAQWTYMDLLFAKIGDAAEIVALEQSKDGRSFLIEQLQISMEIIEAIRPEIIFLFGADAVRFFRAGTHGEDPIWMGYRCVFDDRFGVHVIRDLHPGTLKRGVQDTALRGIPVVMLDSFKRMDPFAFQRFVNQMQQILWVYNAQFGVTYPGSPVKIMEAFVEMAADVEKWTELMNHYVARQDYFGSTETRDRLHEAFDKIEVLLVKIIR